MSLQRLRQMLIKHEGLRFKPYLYCCGKYWRECVCTKKGRLTVGVGRNLDDVGLSHFESMMLLSTDIDRVSKEAVENFPWFKSISVPRQDVVLCMIFNLGLAGFKEFKKTIAAIATGDFDRASQEMLSSAWAKQVGIRAQDLAAVMKSGFYI